MKNETFLAVSTNSQFSPDMEEKLKFFLLENKIDLNPKTAERKSFKNINIPKQKQTARVNNSYFGGERRDYLAVENEFSVWYCRIESLWQFGDSDQQVDTAYVRWLENP